LSSLFVPVQNPDLRVAVDTAGGDHGLGVLVEGAVQAYRELGLKSILVGPEADIRSSLAGFGALDLPLEVLHAPDIITMDDSPTRSVIQA